MYQIKFSYVLILYSHICYLAPEFKVQIDSQASALFLEVNAIFQCYEKKKKKWDLLKLRMDASLVGNMWLILD